MTEQPPPKTFPNIQGRCPACRGDSLFIGAGGYVTCSRLDCPNPCAVDQLLHGTSRADQLAAVLAEILQAFSPVSSHTGTRIGWTAQHPIHPDDYDRWTAALHTPKEQ